MEPNSQACPRPDNATGQPAPARDGRGGSAGGGGQTPTRGRCRSPLPLAQWQGAPCIPDLVYLSAPINCGDGTTSSDTIQGGPGGGNVSGSHT
jgi:hypothetical protein